MADDSKDVNQWVLITGASAGIGEAFARRFAEEGWRIVLAARSRGRLDAVARSLGEQFGTRSRVIAADLTEPDSAQMIYDGTVCEGITVHGLVNNAGMGSAGKFVDVPAEDYLNMVHLNIRALMQLTKLFLPGMMERRSGFVLNVSSLGAFGPLPHGSVYAATKAFVSSFTEALWMETRGSGVRVLNLCPGLVKTDFGIKAGYSDFKLDPMAQSPESLAAAAMRALKTGQLTSVPRLRNKIVRAAVQWLPHEWLLPLTSVYQNWRMNRKAPEMERYDPGRQGPANADGPGTVDS